MRHTSISVLFILAFILIGCGPSETQLKGKAYGQDHSLKECNDESMGMLTECRVMGCDFNPADFAKGCAETSHFDAQYCKTIPVNSAIESVKWLEEQCQDHDTPKSCTQVLKHSVARCIGGV